MLCVSHPPAVIDQLDSSHPWDDPSRLFGPDGQCAAVTLPPLCDSGILRLSATKFQPPPGVPGLDAPTTVRVRVTGSMACANEDAPVMLYATILPDGTNFEGRPAAGSVPLVSGEVVLGGDLETGWGVKLTDAQVDGVWVVRVWAANGDPTNTATVSLDSIKLEVCW